MTLSVIAADGALRPYFPRALHVYDDLASDLLTDANVKLPRYSPFVSLTDELESVVTFNIFLNHSKAMTGIDSPFCCDALHSNVALLPISAVTLRRKGVGAPSKKRHCQMTSSRL